MKGAMVLISSFLSPGLLLHLHMGFQNHNFLRNDPGMKKKKKRYSCLVFIINQLTCLVSLLTFWIL